MSAFTELPVEWLGTTADGYTFSGMRLLGTPTWSKGPIVDLQYSRATSGGGTGLLDIREFTVADNYAAVLQVVQMGSATYVDIHGMPAVYVDGAWVQPPTASTVPSSEHLWQSGQRSELIVQKGGLILWIVGDQRDGLGQDQLVQIASDLSPINQRAPQFGWLKRYGMAGIPRQPFRDPPSGEVYRLVPRGASPGNGVDTFVAGISMVSRVR